MPIPNKNLFWIVTDAEKLNHHGEQSIDNYNNRKSDNFYIEFYPDSIVPKQVIDKNGIMLKLKHTGGESVNIDPTILEELNIKRTKNNSYVLKKEIGILLNRIIYNIFPSLNGIYDIIKNGTRYNDQELSIDNYVSSVDNIIVQIERNIIKDNQYASEWYQFINEMTILRYLFNQKLIAGTFEHIDKLKLLYDWKEVEDGDVEDFNPQLPEFKNAYEQIKPFLTNQDTLLDPKKPDLNKLKRFYENIDKIRIAFNIITNTRNSIGITAFSEADGLDIKIVNKPNDVKIKDLFINSFQTGMESGLSDYIFKGCDIKIYIITDYFEQDTISTTTFSKCKIGSILYDPAIDAIIYSQPYNNKKNTTVIGFSNCTVDDINDNILAGFKVVLISNSQTVVNYILKSIKDNKFKTKDIPLIITDERLQEEKFFFGAINNLPFSIQKKAIIVDNKETEFKLKGSIYKPNDTYESVDDDMIIKLVSLLIK